MNTGPYYIHAKFQHLAKTTTCWTKLGKITRKSKRHI